LRSSKTNCGYNTFEVFQHIVVSKTEYTISARGKPSVTSFIMPHALNKIVALAIDFDNELAGVRNEVCSVVTHRGLTAKSKRSKPMRFQMAP
jgi:hypothetical protein